MDERTQKAANRIEGGTIRQVVHAWPGTVLLYLLLGLPATGQGQDATERVFWESTECHSLLQVQAYLEVYPDGAYVTEARACLEQQLNLSRADRILVQQGLAALNYSAGVADGLFGPATRRAIRAWQAKKEFAATGYLTREQAEALVAQGRETSAMRQTTSVAATRIRPDQTCVGRAENADCWMELSTQAGCYVWNPGLMGPSASVTWPGACSNGLAHGEGELVWTWVSDGGKWVGTATGLLRDGKQYGHWVLRSASGAVSEGAYVDGREHGHWVMRSGSGTVHEGPFVDGKRHGHWAIRFESGMVSEGPFVDGKEHGRWVTRLPGELGLVFETMYVNGQSQ